MLWREDTGYFFGAAQDKVRVQGTRGAAGDADTNSFCFDLYFSSFDLEFPQFVPYFDCSMESDCPKVRGCALFFPPARTTLQATPRQLAGNDLRCHYHTTHEHASPEIATIPQ